jgi:hypothetical protein
MLFGGGLSDYRIFRRNPVPFETVSTTPVR